MSYKIIRFYADSHCDKEVIATGLTLEDAQEHCEDPETSSRTCSGQDAMNRTRKFGPWFDGYDEE